MKELRMSEEIMNNFQESYGFIQDHPAFGWREINVDMDIRNCCRNGYDLNMTPKEIYIDKDNPRHREMLELSKIDPEIQLEFWDDGEPLKEIEAKYQLPAVKVPYKTFFGYKWEEDHIEIWLESGAMRYIEQENRWERWHDSDVEASGRTYEDAIINLASRIKSVYGDFHKDTRDNVLIPEWVKEWNQKHPLSIDDLFSNGRMNAVKYISINGIHFNELWWHKHGNEKTSMSVNYKPVDISFLLDYKEFKKKYV